mgnify:CR=1 FL=1
MSNGINPSADGYVFSGKVQDYNGDLTDDEINTYSVGRGLKINNGVSVNFLNIFTLLCNSSSFTISASGLYKCILPSPNDFKWI